MHVAKDLVAASATPMVLGILPQGESYGYAILKRVNEMSAGELAWTDGLLYPLLHRSERAGSSRRPGAPRRVGVDASTGSLPTDVAELAEQRRQWAAVDSALRKRGDSLDPSTGRSAFQEA